MPTNESFMKHKRYFDAAMEKRLIDGFASLPLLANDWDDVRQLIYVRVIGELYPTQRKDVIDYGDETKFAVFHVTYCWRTNDMEMITHCDWNEVVAICKHLKLDTVPVIDALNGLPLDDIWTKFDTKFDTKFSNKTDNTCEGIVVLIDAGEIKNGKGDDGVEVCGKLYGVSEALVVARNYATPIFIKKQNEQFLERSKRKMDPKIKRDTAATIKNDPILHELKDLCVEQRVANADSKHDFTVKCSNEFLTAFLADYRRLYVVDDEPLSDYAFEDLYRKPLLKFARPLIFKYLHGQHLK